MAREGQGNDDRPQGAGGGNQPSGGSMTDRTDDQSR